MLKLIVEKELLARFSDATFVIACILSAMLIFLSFYLSTRNYSDLVKDYNSIQALNRNSLQAQETYRDIDNDGIDISKPPEVLSIFTVGIANYIGRNLNIDSYSTPQLDGSKVEGNPVFAIFGDLDLTFIVKYIFSLLAIVLSYNMLSGEKEGGTLRLIASFPVPRDILILGKLIGGLLCLLIPLLIPTLLGMVVLLILPNIHFTNDDYLRLMLILGVFLLYLTVFFLIGTFVSSRTKSSSVSFLIALFIWVLLVLIIPKSSTILATQFIHVPSRQQHSIQEARVMSDIYQKYNQKEKQVWEDEKRNMEAIPPTMDRETRFELHNKRTEEIKQKMKEIYEQQNTELENAQARMDREYQQQQQNLANLAITLSRISPASAMTHATMSFADTSLGSFDHFIRSARAYRERFIAFIKEKLPDNIRTGSVTVFVEEIRERGSTEGDSPLERMKRNKPNFQEIPVFTYQKMSLASVVQETLIDILLLVLLALLFFVGTYVSFLKYDVR